MEKTHHPEGGTAGAAPRRRSRRKAGVAVAAAVVVVLGGTFTYFNTNVLDSDRICHGWTTPDEAAAALGGGIGRVSASEDSDATCTVRVSSWLPGQDKRLSLRAVGEETEFPFSRGDWQISGDRHVLSGGTQGAFDAYGGWTLLPTACRNAADGSGTQPVLRAAVTGRDTAGDADAMGRLLTSATPALSAASYCGEPADADTTTDAPSAAEPSDLDRVCGISGFRLPRAQGPKGQQVTAEVTGSLPKGLYCDLTFEGDKEGPFARLAVVSDPALVASFKGRDVTRAECDGRETVFAQDLRYFDDSERAVTHVPAAPEFSEVFGDAARAALQCG
ncbi:hypothetical protein OKJ48_01130 [Streptomyces kunmingensis]|uniref:Uncharacterized protein n=1 Tax=Streptomyces kunmingensis TaxID=68225 RepID=A0ABU6C2E8_9ACTN|nr:hypothetical protein [Streptomyces kunmingensis]MEB3958868.1 hypothetical protein [Streptomyces kunmingensis]